MDTFKNKNFISSDDKEEDNSHTSNNYIHQNKESDPNEEDLNILNDYEVNSANENILTNTIQENKLQQLIDNESQYICY